MKKNSSLLTVVLLLFPLVPVLNMLAMSYFMRAFVLAQLSIWVIVGIAVVNIALYAAFIRFGMNRNLIISTPIRIAYALMSLLFFTSSISGFPFPWYRIMMGELFGNLLSWSAFLGTSLAVMIPRKAVIHEGDSR